jgi:phage terminase large subunit-like protein
MIRAQQLMEEARRRAACPFRTYFPDTGPLRRELYPRSMEFIAAGALRWPNGTYVYPERMFMAANRTSKTVTAAYETTAHLTGRYPAWWHGRRFEGPIDSWVAGDTHETTRDIIQLELCGERLAVKAGKYGGMIPCEYIVDRALKSGVSDSLDTIWVRHVERHHGAPCTSTLGFKAYNQGRLSFQGTKKHWIWLDEEAPDAGSSEPSGGGTPSGNGDVYTECLLRTATCAGAIVTTFTPLRGLTPFVDQFLATAMMADATGSLINAKSGLFGEKAA